MLHRYRLAPLAAFALLAVPRLAHAQATPPGGVTIGAATAPDPSAVLDLRSTSKGLLLPRLSLAQRQALTASATAPPVPGLVIYQTDNTPSLYAYDGTAWVRLGADNLGNHTATQTLNLQANALVGTGDDLGSTVGMGVRSDGGLNLGQNTTGNSLYLGYQAGSVSTGAVNLFTGYQSGFSNTTGSANLFSGSGSGYYNTAGNFNVFSGNRSGFFNTTGSYNLFSGFRSGFYNMAGSYNAFIGFNSGQYNGDGNNNTALGFDSGPDATSPLTNTTALGARATVFTSNTIQLGNYQITELRCQVGLTVTSDARFKYDVQANVPGLAFIERLRPVTYRFDQARLTAFTQTGALPAPAPPTPGPKCAPASWPRTWRPPPGHWLPLRRGARPGQRPRPLRPELRPVCGAAGARRAGATDPDSHPSATKCCTATAKRHPQSRNHGHHCGIQGPAAAAGKRGRRAGPAVGGGA